MNIKTNIPVTDDYVSDGVQSWVRTPSFNGIYIKGDGFDLNVKGDIVRTILL